MANVKDIINDFITVDDALTLDYETTKELQLKHLNKQRTLLGNSKYFVKADGSKFIDYNGDEHLDMIGGVGVVTIGNNNEYIWNELEKVFKAKYYMMGTVAYHSIAAAFAANMAKLSPGGQLTKMGTATAGAEAIEGSLKLVKLATRDKPEKDRIIACENAFHGKTTGAVSVGGKEIWRKYQHPLMEDVDHVPYGDADALEDALKKGCYMAFYVEPIQGEGGIIVPPEGYLAKCRELCDKYDAIMVLDEIQAGCGRTGKMWAVEHENIVPDVIVFAKGFSGGLIPFGGYICKEEIYDAAYGSPETCFHHTATYQENGMSTAAGLATLQYMLENDLIKQAGEKGEYLIGKLKEIQAKYPGVIKEVRGKGMMIGIEFFDIPAEYQDGYAVNYSDPIQGDLNDKYRIQCIHTINNAAVFRFLPAITISKEEIDYALDSLEKAVSDAAAKTGK